MISKNVLLQVTLLLCLGVLIHPATAGSGCGTNWLGSDSNDQDFWVSKNQNSDIAGANMKMPATSSTNPEITSLISDKVSPQEPGVAITWTAEATAPQMDQIRYKFLLKGPSTEGAVIDKTGWTTGNSWVWNTSQADAGENQIEVRIKYGQNLETDGFDASKTETFVIEAIDSEEKTEDQQKVIDPNPHPKTTRQQSSNIGSGLSTATKPRIAPDERPKSYPAPGKVNMSMPDPTPKLPVSEDDTGEASTDTYVLEEVNEPEILDVSGKWSVMLEGSIGYLDLILIQSDTMIMGSGSLIDGQNKISVTTSGSVSGDEINLEAKTVVREYGNQIDKRYKMDLNMVDGSLRGSYEAYDGETLASKGNATASKPGQ